MWGILYGKAQVARPKPNIDDMVSRLLFPQFHLSTMSSDSAIPQSRVIVLCFDGTSSQFDETVRTWQTFSVAVMLTCENIRTPTSSSSTVY